ncbi:MAG: hypothetical protein WCF97_03465 [Nitrososphaeraceae archaeon]
MSSVGITLLSGEISSSEEFCEFKVLEYLPRSCLNQFPIDPNQIIRILNLTPFQPREGKGPLQFLKIATFH